MLGVDVAAPQAANEVLLPHGAVHPSTALLCAVSSNWKRGEPFLTRPSWFRHEDDQWLQLLTSCGNHEEH